MECSQQTEWLEDLNLNLDIETKSDIITYMHKIVGEVAHEKAELLTYAAAAIVGELKKMPSVGSESTVPAREDAKNGETVEARQLVGVGITIEKIMRRLQPPHSKEQFLDVLGKALSKDPTIPHALNFKVGRVALTYRMFKKYRQTF